jgi:hypothetical protein
MTAVRTYTADDLYDLRARRRGERIRFDVLDRNFNKLFEIHPERRNVSMTNDTSRAIKRTLTGVRIPPSEQQLIDLAGHRLQPWWILPELDDERPLGVYLFQEADAEERTFGSFLSAQCVDQWHIMDQGRLSPFSVPIGRPYTDALKTLTTEVGLPRVEIDTSLASPASPMAWPPGESRLKIIEDIAELLAFQVFFANDGTFRARATPDLESAPATLRYTETDVDLSRIVRGSVARSDDLYKAPNIYLVVSTGANEEAIFGAYTIPSTAPHSRAKRGYPVVKTVTAQGLASNSQADLIAIATANDDRYASRFVTFDGPPDPRHDTYDIIEVLGVRYREISQTLPLRAGARHQHHGAELFTDDIVPFL